MTATAPARRSRPLHALIPDRPGDAALLTTRVAAAGAWVALVAPALSAGAHAGHSNHDAAAGPSTPAAWVLAYGLMVVAMMWPLTDRVAGMVYRTSFRSRRALHVGVLLAVSTALWLAYGAVLRAVALILGQAATPWWSAAWLGVALALTWQPRRARLLRTCLRLPALHPGGRRGLATAARAAFIFWRRCALLCGPVMAAMVSHHGLTVMALASAAVWWEQWHPRAAHDLVPRVLLLAALVSVVVGLP
jgi:hypothetical protein